MAEDSTQKSKLPSNEEIIDELTKDISDFAISENVPAGATNTTPVSKDLNSDAPTRDDSFDEDSGGAEDDSSAKDEDYIDEVALKDAEVTYTEEDKKRLQKEALEAKESGNELFRAGEFRPAAQKYTLALRTCPLAFPADRAALFCNRAACKMKLELLKSGVEDCTEAIALKPDYVKAFLRRAGMYERLEKLDEALADYKEILKLDPGNKDAYAATMRLPGEINERNEKMKTEMLGKLKELGNMVLRPFGLSTDNFQVNQDPNSGGYSINFQQNSK
ncbi:tetratricopeptide repeat protein 1 [Bacillus rossius redtenbacheri]|uniref:tetratricopeptide repeat protein 1 n=1 Tax=Bacillus rossius redtenbacheri TaxID=93214 RepID=UPI002FDDD16F